MGVSFSAIYGPHSHFVPQALKKPFVNGVGFRVRAEAPLPADWHLLLMFRLGSSAQIQTVLLADQAGTPQIACDHNPSPVLPMSAVRSVVGKDKLAQRRISESMRLSEDGEFCRPAPGIAMPNDLTQVAERRSKIIFVAEELDLGLSAFTDITAAARQHLKNNAWMLRGRGVDKAMIAALKADRGWRGDILGNHLSVFQGLEPTSEPGLLSFNGNGGQVFKPFPADFWGVEPAEEKASPVARPSAEPEEKIEVPAFPEIVGRDFASQGSNRGAHLQKLYWEHGERVLSFSHLLASFPEPLRGHVGRLCVSRLAADRDWEVSEKVFFRVRVDGQNKEISALLPKGTRVLPKKVVVTESIWQKHDADWLAILPRLLAPRAFRRFDGFRVRDGFTEELVTSSNLTLHVGLLAADNIGRCEDALAVEIEVLGGRLANQEGMYYLSTKPNWRKIGEQTVPEARGRFIKIKSLIL